MSTIWNMETWDMDRRHYTTCTDGTWNKVTRWCHYKVLLWSASTCFRVYTSSMDCLGTGSCYAAICTKAAVRRRLAVLGIHYIYIYRVEAKKHIIIIWWGVPNSPQGHFTNIDLAVVFSSLLCNMVWKLKFSFSSLKVFLIMQTLSFKLPLWSS